MAKNKNISFSISIGNIVHTFTYYPNRNAFRITSHHNLLNETKFHEFCEISRLSRDVTQTPYDDARLFFMDVIKSHIDILLAPIENKYFQLPF